MKYGVDYDGTIADTNSIKVAWIKKNLGIDVVPWKTDKTSCVPIIGAENYERMEIVYERELTLKAGEIPGAIRSLLTLARRGEIYLVTARPVRRLAFAKEWLLSRGVLDLFRGIKTSVGANGEKRTKEQICRELGLDVLIDDDERHLRDNQMPGLRRILIKSGSPEKVELPNGMGYARSWDEVVGLVMQA